MLNASLLRLSGALKLGIFLGKTKAQLKMFQLMMSLAYCCAETVCCKQVFHPNIDLEGNICLNILREDWKPVLSISSIIYGLQFLFLVSHLWPPVLFKSASDMPVSMQTCMSVYIPKSHFCANSDFMFWGGSMVTCRIPTLMIR